MIRNTHLIYQKEYLYNCNISFMLDVAVNTRSTESTWSVKANLIKKLILILTFYSTKLHVIRTWPPPTVTMIKKRNTDNYIFVF